MKRGCLVTISFALASVVAGCGDSSSRSRDGEGVDSTEAATTHPGGATLIARAKELSDEGLNVEAARLLDERKDEVSEEERPELYPLIADYYHAGGVHDRAVEYAELALSAGIQSPEVLFIYGDSLRARRRFKEARSQLETLLRKDPQHRLGKLALARVLLRSADPREALPLFESFFDGAPANGQPDRAALLDYGRALRAVQEYRRAADRFALLLVADPFDAEAYSELAQTFYRRGMRPEGRFIQGIYREISQAAFEEHVEAGLRASGMTSFALGQRALNEVRQKRFLSAFQDYETAMRIDPGEPRLRIFYANLCLRFRRTTAGVTVLREALEAGVVPASGLWMAKALLEFDRDEPAAALESSRAGLAALEREGELGGHERGQGTSLTLLLGVARGALETGDLDAARSAVERAGALHPSAWEPEYWRGRIELARSRLNAAASAFSQARARGAGGTFADLDYWTAVLLRAQGDVPGAVEKLQTVLRTQGGHERAYKLLAEILGSAGDGRASTLRKTHGHVPATVRRIRELEAVIDRRALQEVGAEYLELGRLYRQLRDPAAFDLFFLASDLVPANADVLRELISGMTRPQDVFMRLQCLHRLLEIEPDFPGALADTASIYIRLNVRLDVARELAERLHRTSPSAVSYRLRGELELREGNREAGLRLLEEGLRKYPGDARLREALEKANRGGAEDAEDAQRRKERDDKRR